MDENDISRLRQNDKEAWDRLIQQFHRVVISQFWENGVPEASHEELGQEVWTKVVVSLRKSFSLQKARPGRTLDDALRFYIAAIAHNKAVDWHRRRPRRTLPLGDRHLAAPADGPLPMELEEWRAGLSGDEQTVLTRFLAGGTAKSISEEIARPLGDVYRILRELRAKLTAGVTAPGER